MLKQPKIKIPLVVGTGVCALVVGVGLPAAKLTGLWDQWFGRSQPPLTELIDKPPVKAIGAAKTLTASQRREKLAAIANSKPSLDRNRARYLLASDLIDQDQGQKALEPLKGLETDYPVLAPHVLLKRAQAYELAGNGAKAQDTWRQMLQQYPSDPASAEALVALSLKEPKYGDQAIAQFPSHPLTVKLVQKRLKQNPNQPQLLLLIAKHALYSDNYLDVLDRLVKDYAAQLSPQDWEAIAFGYWEKQLYGKAGEAYARAPYNALTAYRIARGRQLGEKDGVVQAYQRVVKDFPIAPETSLALLRLARLTEPTTAIAYLDQIVRRFPDRAGEAMLERAKLLDKLNSEKSASETRQILLTRFASTDAAATLRWETAQKYAAARDYQTALQWVESLLKHNTQSELAPQAGFWLGKWAGQTGKYKDAKNAFEQVLSRYPQSYYAWRSASMLGWEVGDFNTVRQLNPTVKRPTTRPDLPTGSAALKELHQIGQDEDAWRRWQMEFGNPMQPSVAEQFTDGVIRLGVGDYLDGIFMVSFLSEREKPAEKSQYRALRQESGYWQALYPFPFLEPIETWSQQRQLNPLLVTALIRQESRFMPGIRSSVGATGLMQVMPETATWIADKIKLKQYQLNDPDDNIKLGTWYLDYTHQEYSGNSMLAIASYNAGPGKVADWVTQKGVADPDVFVESIPYDETRGYVKSVFENYWNYLRLYNPEISKKVEQVSAEHPVGVLPQS